MIKIQSSKTGSSKTFSFTTSKIEDVLNLYPKKLFSKAKNYPELLPTLEKDSPNLKWDRWEQSYDALKSTLEYISRLETKVYILIIEDNKIKAYVKFDPKITGKSNELLKYIKNRDKSIHWSKKDIETLNKTKWKFMSCILQDRKEERDEYPYETTFIKLAEKYELPNGAYIFSLRDALLIHKEHIHPWVQITGDKLPFKNFPSKFIPVFNSTGGHDYWDIPIPNFEDKNYIFKKEPNLENINLNWETKIPTAVFRGSGSGCGYDSNNNQRIKLAKISQILSKEKDEEIRTLLDAGLSSKSLKRKYRFYNGKVGYFDFNKEKLAEVNRLNKVQQSNYKYIIYVEGNVAAHRLAVDMLLGSVILYVKSTYTLWFEHLMKENVHYISVNEDLSNLIEVIQWCRKNEGKCKEIAMNARNFAKDILTEDVYYNIFANYIRSF